MVASKARKERRSLLLSHKLEEPREHHPKKRFKSGRQEKRTVTRHTRRHDASIEDELSSDLSEEIDEVESDINSDTELGDRGNNRKLYQSLLTLLQHDHQEPELKISKQSVQEIEEEEEDEETIAGAMEGEEDEDVEEEQASSDDEDDEVNTDPFNSHFNDEDKIDSQIESYKALMKQDKRRLILVNKEQVDNFTILESVPDIDQLSISKQQYNETRFHLKKRLIEKFESQNLSPVEKFYCNSMFQYQNINLQYYDNDELEKSYQDLYLIHCLDHIFKTRDRILKNNAKKQQVLENIAKKVLKPEDEPDFRDQGYTRPKVLILLPTRNFAYELVMKLISILSMDSTENKSKFTKQFYDEFEFDNESRKSTMFKKFFKGNTNDFFCVGLKFTRKTLKLYSSFETSDIIIASPIGLKMLLDKKPQLGKPANRDFLSSIEILVLDKSHGLLMQNWDHVSHILKNLNLPPKSFNEKVDFSRVRMWSINDNAKYLTQFLNFTRVTTPELNNLTNLKSWNLRGSLLIKPRVDDNNSMINRINKYLTVQGILNNETRLRQVFQRFDAPSIQEEPNARFKFFVNVILPQVLNKSSYKSGILIYVPSYMDYLRLMNYFKNQSKLQVLNIDEYSSQLKLTRNRMLFEKQLDKFKIMLYTERLHFYKNYNLKGVKNLIFYDLPTDPQYYQDCINFLVRTKLQNDLIVNGILKNEPQDDENFDLNLSMIRILNSKFDLIKLEKLVGLSKLNVLCNGVNEVYEFR